MSAYLVGYGTVDQAVAALALARFSVDGITLRDQHGCICRKGATELGRRLVALNAEAVRSRYPSAQVPGPAFVDYHYTGCGVAIAGRLKPAPEKKVQVFKSLECLAYQCAEDDTAEQPLTKEIGEALADLAVQVVRESPAYAAAVWG